MKMVLISKDSLHVETLLKDGVSIYSNNTKDKHENYYFAKTNQ